MAGFFGSDFDPATPPDSDSVKYGAGWIRDLKARVQRFASTLFDLESGQLRDNVVPSTALTNSGVVPGTYTSITVNDKGLAIAGSNPAGQQTAAYWRAIFSARGSYFIERASGILQVSGAPDTNGIYLQQAAYGGSGAPFNGAVYAVAGAGYSEYVFAPPAGVRRVKATLVGGAGGAYDSGSGTWYGGGGADLVEAVFPVDGTGLQTLKLIVGQGGTSNSSGDAADGCPSRVELSLSVFADAGPGKGATTLAGGANIEGEDTTSLAVIRSKGRAGAADTFGASGSTYYDYGAGGGRGQTAGDGGVILEWVL